jgi:hypothetical protein
LLNNRSRDFLKIALNLCGAFRQSGGHFQNS